MLMAVDVELNEGVTLGIPKELFLFKDNYMSEIGRWTPYSLSPDGELFLVILSTHTDTEAVGVILNWFDELERRVPTSR